MIFGTSNGQAPAAGGHFLVQTITSGRALCSAQAFGDADPGHAKSCWSGPIPGLAPGKVSSAGGSDYPFYAQNDQAWDNNQLVVVGQYNLNPGLVQAQLQQMYATGQRDVSLVIWYMPFGASNTPVNWVYAAAFLDSEGGHLSTLAQQNLVAVLNIINQLGFRQVTLRFAPVGLASPVTWGNTWNEPGFQQDESILFSTRQIVEAAMATSSVKRVYDLGVEMAGIQHVLDSDGFTYADGQTPEWTARLWADYVRNYGKADTYGFSIPYAPGALTQAIAEYDQAGTRPNSYAIDDYAINDLWNVYQELLGANDLAKPIVMQETSYNDAGQMQGIANALQHFPLTIAYIDQWPTSVSMPYANASPPTNYSAYGGSTDTAGTIIVTPCTLASGQTACTAQASWATSNAANIALFANGVPVANLPNIATSLSGAGNFTLGLGATNLLLVSSQQAFGNGTHIASGSDLGPGQSILASQTATAQDATAPIITSAGVGGPNLQNIWAIGSNLSFGCSVQLHDANAPAAAAIANLTGVGCTSTSLSFALPAAVSTTYAALTFTVTNPGSSPSAPYSLPIQPIPVLTAAGIGGPNNGAIWAIGQNMTSSCSVRLYDPNAPGAPAIVTLGINCASNNLNFAIPAGIQGNYHKLNVTVVNSDWQQSAPVPITLY